MAVGHVDELIGVPVVGHVVAFAAGINQGRKFMTCLRQDGYFLAIRKYNRVLAGLLQLPYDRWRSIAHIVVVFLHIDLLVFARASKKAVLRKMVLG